MVLRVRDIKPRVTLETYVSYPSLKRVAIPMAVGKNGEAVGLIPKIHSLDPFISTHYIYIDPIVIDRAHSEITEGGEIKRLFGEKAIKQLESTFKPVTELVSDKVVNKALRKSKKWDFNDVGDSGLLKWQELVLQNGGWLVRPQILLNDIKGTKDEHGFEITKEDMPNIDPCKYTNPKGIVPSESSFSDFIRAFDIKDSDKNIGMYKTIYEIVKRGKENITTSDIDKIKLLLPTSASEKEKIKVLRNLTGLPENYVKTHFVMKSSTTKSDIEDIAQTILEKTIQNQKRNASDKREKACKLVTVLNDLQDRKGWHNRITPISATDTISKAHYILNAKSNEMFEEDIRNADKSIKETANLLSICLDPKDNTSCIHPTDKKNLGMYGRNAKDTFDQTSWIESEMRAYALIDVPIIFYKRTDKINARTKLAKKFLRAIDDAAKTMKNGDDMIYNFKHLKRFGDIVGLKLTDPDSDPIPFTPDLSIDKTLREKDKEITEKIFEYYNGADPSIVSSKLTSFSIPRIDPTSEEIKKMSINFSMMPEYETYSYPKDASGSEIHNGCLRAKLPSSSGSISTSGKFVLLDGDNELIRWRDDKGHRKTIGEVMDEIRKSGGSEKRANPNNWKWVCVSEKNTPENVLTDPKPFNFSLKKVILRRAIDLYYRNNGKDLKLSVDKDSVANALKDIGTTIYNAVNLGNVTSLPNYIETGVETLLSPPKNWDEIRRGGDAPKRLILKRLSDEVDYIQKKLGTEKQFKIAQSLARSKNVSLAVTPMGFDPLMKIFAKRRKNIAKDTIGIPKEIFTDAFSSTRHQREKAYNNATIAVETDLSEIFPMVEKTPSKK